MPWIPLSDRLSQLPLILAGPILRRTESTAVTVWVVLQAACEVTLEVYATEDGHGIAIEEGVDRQPILSGQRSTIALGQSLHLVAVTARPTQSTRGKQLVPGQIYVYDMKFQPFTSSAPPFRGGNFGQIGNTSQPPNGWTLEQALNSAAVPRVTVSYFDHHLPSFALPPEDLNQLRLMHGSCRKAHGNDRDALAILDNLIEQHCTQANSRLHQLFLTGDQVYGDDVADPLLMALTDAGDTLLGWEEHFPVQPSPQRSTAASIAKLTPKSLVPGQRSTIAEALGGFTAGLSKQPERAKSHLFGLGEYCAIYLFVWSPILWTNFPTGREMYRQSKQARAWDQEVGALQRFVQTLWKVRRALANVPTYMIFDDHDVSDDWYLNQAWCLRVLGNPLGKRVVQNALLAYALFQGWGNTPDQFADGYPGEILLQSATTWSASAATDATAEHTIAQYLGLPNVDSMGQPQFCLDSGVLILDRSPSALNWHYRVQGTCHEVIVLDTRTWRGYPANQETQAPPMLLSPTAFDRQLRHPLLTAPHQANHAETQAPEVQATLIVAPTNLVSLEAIDRIQHWNLKQGEVFKNDVGDAWNINKYALSTLLNILFEHRDRIILLSGDIHYGSAVCLHYWARQSSEASPNEGNEKPSVLVQLTSSALKNAEWKTQIVHTKIKSLLPERSQDWVGWNHAPTLLKVKTFLYKSQVKPLPPVTKVPVVERIHRTPRSPYSAWDIAVARPQDLPDWRYHINWIRRQPAQVAFDRPRRPPPHSTHWLGKLRSGWIQRLWNNRWLQEGNEVVGLNNVGVVQLAWSPLADQYTVVQDLYWYAPWRSGMVVFSRYEASVELQPPPPPLSVLENAVIKE